MDIGRSDISFIKDYFPLPCECIRTTGIGDGIILKFKTFYLKIYDSSEHVNSYEIQGYRYHDSRRVLNAIVPENRMSQYAKTFMFDNYLKEFECW